MIIGNALAGKHWQIQGELHHLVGAVQTGNIPFITMATGNNGIFSRITGDELGLIPGSRNALQEINLVLRKLREIIRIDGDTLDGSLVHDSRSHLENISSITAMTTLVILREILVHDGTTPIHRSHGVAAEWMHGQLKALLLGMIIREEYILRSQYSLARYIVRIHALPTSWQGAAMEDNLNAIIVGIAEDVFILLHGMLLVATEEIYLDALDADTLHPGQLLLAGHDVIHDATRTLRCIVCHTIGIIPEHQTHILALRILAQLCYLVSTNLGIPERINQHIFISHGSSQVDELLLVVIVAGFILPDEPAPGILACSVFLGSLESWLYYIVWNGGLYQWLQIRTHGNGTPRSGTRKNEGARCRTDAICLLLHWEGNLITLSSIIIADMTTRIVAVSTRLADQYPASAANLEKTREGIAMTITRLGCKRLIHLIIFFITWFGSGKTDERIRLWTEVSGGYLRQIEGSLLLVYDDMLSLQLIKSITESHIVVAYIESNRHWLLLTVDVCHVELVGMIIYMRNLGGAEVIALLHLYLILALIGQALTEIAYIGKESEL